MSIKPTGDAGEDAPPQPPANKEEMEAVQAGVAHAGDQQAAAEEEQPAVVGRGVPEAAIMPVLWRSERGLTNV